LLGQTLKERVTWDPFEKTFLDSLPSRLPCPCADGNTDEETNDQHQKE